MNKKKVNTKLKKKLSFLFKIIGIISLIIVIAFCISLFILDMLPNKYLILIYGILFIIYTIFSLFIFIYKIKLKIKIFSVVFLIIFDIIFGIGIKYILDTIYFVSDLNSVMYQKEEYYVMTLDSIIVDDIKAFNNNRLGMYKGINNDKVINKLMKTISFNEIIYDDVVKMFEDLKENKIDGIVINNSIKNLFDSELDYLEIELKEVFNFSIDIVKKEDIAKIVDITEKSFNIYVAGGDGYGSIENVTNTDVNMLITVDPVNKKILLTSIPRDYYVNLPSYGDDVYDKLTHVGYYGIEESVKSIEKLLETDINYYVKVNFSTIVGVVDAIGGVDVYSDFAFKERAFKKYKFTKGYNHLNGEQALAFARERKSFIDGDVQRVKNQQKVLRAIIDKATSSTAIITNFSKILDSVSSSVSTNVNTGYMNKFVKMQLNDMSSWDIESQNLTGYDYYSMNTYTFPTFNLYVMKPDENSILSAKEKMNEYFKGE